VPPFSGQDFKSIVTLSGGVGAARFLRGLVQVVSPEKLTAIVNTGDDATFYGVRVCPDLDIITYTLAGIIDPVHGFGIAGDSFQIVDRLAQLGHETWFRLGDRDYATCLHRTLRLAAGEDLRSITRILCEHHGLAIQLLPMSLDPCPTQIELEDGRRMHFEEYLIEQRAPAGVRAIDLSAANAARPGPGVLDTIEAADAILVCPSNPAVSIGPILAVPGIRKALSKSKAPIVAISPIIQGAPVKGPAHRLLPALGAKVSALGVAKLYQGLVRGFVIDELDRKLAPAIAALGMKVGICDTLMNRPGVDKQLAERALSLAETL